MSGAPVLRSAALQRTLALSAKRATPVASSDNFADTLAQVSQSAANGPAGSRAAVAAAWSAATQKRFSAVAPATATGSTSAARIDVSQSVGSGPIPFADLITAAAKRHGVEPALLAAVVKQESNFDPRARSGVGAKGLTQLMDATARGLGVADSFDPAQSLEGGARFLGGLLKQFKGDERLALAAYNAGPGAVQKYGGIPPYQETQRYVPKVLGYAAQYRRIWADSAGASTPTIQTD